MKRSTNLFAVLATLLPALNLSAGEYVEFPAEGIFDTDEGTIEWWMKVNFDPYEMKTGYHGLGAVFHLDFGDPTFERDSFDATIGTKHTPGRTRSDMSFMMRFGIIVDDQGLNHPLLVDMGQDLPANEWFHVALTWDASSNVILYINGKEQSKHRFVGDFDRTPRKEARLYFGSSPTRQRMTNPFALDDIRISSIARRPGDLLADEENPRKDIHTLLLLTFDSEEMDASSILPDYAATEMAEQGIPTPTAYRLIPGKTGNALAFTTDTFEE